MLPPEGRPLDWPQVHYALGQALVLVGTHGPEWGVSD